MNVKAAIFFVIIAAVVPTSAQDDDYTVGCAKYSDCTGSPNLDVANNLCFKNGFKGTETVNCCNGCCKRKEKC